MLGVYGQLIIVRRKNMSIMVLKDLMIEKGLLNKYYEGVVPKDLWRALKKKSNLQIFDFVEEPFKLSNGRPRPRDITIKVKNGERWVFVKDKPRGLAHLIKKEFHLAKAGNTTLYQLVLSYPKVWL
jgi:hypothetical protein